LRRKTEDDEGIGEEKERENMRRKREDDEGMGK
jgi:hypothetical protein